MPVADDVRLGEGVSIPHPSLVNLYGCEVGAGTTIGPFVEIQRGAVVGRLCKIQSHAFICDGVVIEDEVFVGHGVMFTNDRDPRAVNSAGVLATDADWTMAPVRVARAATIGSNATVVGPVTIGEGALVAAGAVVTGDVEPWTVVAGVPARKLRDRERTSK